MSTENTEINQEQQVTSTEETVLEDSQMAMRTAVLLEDVDHDAEEAEEEDESPEALRARIAEALPVVREFLETVLGLMGVDVDVDIDEEEDGLHCDIHANRNDGGVLIGRHGNTLDSLQFLVLRVLQASGLGKMRITLDVGGYRRRREQTLRDLADKIADRVLRNGRAYHFEAMSATERRVIHTAMLDYPELKTESEGEGRQRHVVVSLVDDEGNTQPEDSEA